CLAGKETRRKRSRLMASRGLAAKMIYIHKLAFDFFFLLFLSFRHHFIQRAVFSLPLLLQPPPRQIPNQTHAAATRHSRPTESNTTNLENLPASPFQCQTLPARSPLPFSCDNN